ncbi:MAG: glycoside hydrolase family 97 C-terminal domain-containing protein, partial [Ginsengibacter sp.]
VLENHMSMVCDEPEAYEGLDGFELLTEMPTVWDETVVPGAGVGEWVTVARRKATDWYVGTINNTTARTITIPLGFLPSGNYAAKIYNDVPDAVRHPNLLMKESKDVNKATKLTLDLAAGGGQVIHLRAK